MNLFLLILFSFVDNVHLLPILPSFYKTGVEVKTYWKDRVLIYSGSESRSHNKYAIRLHRIVLSNTTNSVKRDASYLILLDYNENLGRSLEVTNGRKKCIDVFNITDDKRFNMNDLSFDSPVVSTRTLLGAQDRANDSYIGMAVVRNMNCHHWQRKERNETVDYYFREKDQGKMILVRIVESNPELIRHSTYDYFAFQNIQPSMDEIEPPRGTYCSIKNVQPLKTPTLPKQMTMSMEYRPMKLIQQINIWMVIGFKVYWDEVESRLRTDHHVKINGHWIPVKDIIDSWRGIHYEVFSPTNCRVSQYYPMSESVNPFFKNAKRHFISLKKAIEHYKEYTKDYEHQGEHTVRGIPTDVWVYKNVMLGQEGLNEIEWYFTKPNVTEVASLGKNREIQNPVRIVGYYGNNTKEYFEMDIFDFRHDVDNDAFTRPIRDCLDLSSSSVSTLDIFIADINTTAIREVHDLSSFTNYSMQAILKALNINDKSRFLTEFIVGQNYVTLILSIVDYPYQPKNALPTKVVAKALQNLLEEKPLSFTYQVNGTEYKGTMRLSPMPWNYRKPQTKCDKDNNGITILAVFVVIAFVVGLCIMYAVLYYVLRRKGTSLTELLRTKKKFENEIVTRENGAPTTEIQTTES